MTGQAQSAARPRVRIERKEETRRRLLEAARKLFTERGFFETRASDIAQAAGVAHGTVFAHFGSKAGLLLCLLEEFTAQRIALHARLTEQARGWGASPAQEFWSVLENIWKSDLENLGLIRAYASYSWVWDAELERAHRELRAANRDSLMDILTRSVAPDPQGHVGLESRVALFYAEYREQLRIHTPEREAELWGHIKRMAEFLFPIGD